MVIGMLILGFVLLVAGADLLVRGASRVALASGISSLVVGLTVVAFGTSAPELAVSVQAGLTGQADIALGNVVGSNIFNVLFILGLCALIRPLIVARQLTTVDVPVMIGASILLLVMARDGEVSRLEGAFLFAGIVAYTVYLVVKSRREGKLIETPESREEAKREKSPARLLRNLVFIAAGLGLLVWGADMLVTSAIQIAHTLGVSDLVISLTIVAAGTSLPEVATSALATIRGEREIAIGNVIGSSTFNILSVLGLSALCAPHGIVVAPAAMQFDLPIMLITACICFPVFYTGRCISRFEGGIFLLSYIAYVVYLVLDAAHSDNQQAYSSIMLFVVAPLVVLTVATVWYHDHRRDGSNTRA